MAIAKCTEDGNNQPEFDFDISGLFDGGPRITFLLPYECWTDGYDGCGIFHISLEELLDETVSTVIQDDWGKSAHKITKLLREYADKIDAEAEAHKEHWGSDDSIIAEIKENPIPYQDTTIERLEGFFDKVFSEKQIGDARNAVTAFDAIVEGMKAYRDMVDKSKSRFVTRKAFVCIHCEGVYADDPVSSCDCMEGSGHDFIEGVIHYQAAAEVKSSFAVDVEINPEGMEWMKNLSKEGWVENDKSGVCPVPAGQQIQIKFADGEVMTTSEPEGFIWYSNGCAGDITHYRVICSDDKKAGGES